MDASETTRLRALLERATPRPWHNGGLNGDVVGAVIEDDAEDNVALLSRRSSEGPASEDHEAWANGDLIVAAVNALPTLCDEVDRLRTELRDARADLDAQSFLRPHPSKRTGVRCARCGRDGGVDVGDDMRVCSWCSDAVAVECERDALRAIIAGRMTPPTDTDVVAHGARGGAWLIQGGRWVTPSVQVFTVASSRDWYADRGVARWWPLDAEGRPCAWPAEVSR